MSDTSIHRVSRSIDVMVPAGAFMEVICDFERYPEFVTNMLTSRIEALTVNQWRVAFEVVLFRRHLRYSLDLRRQGERVLSWSLVAGDWMVHNTGDWTLSPLTEESLRAVYSIEVDVEGVLPHAVTSLLIDSSIPRLLRDFKRRAELLVGSPMGDD